MHGFLHSTTQMLPNGSQELESRCEGDRGLYTEGARCSISKSKLSGPAPGKLRQGSARPGWALSWRTNSSPEAALAPPTATV